MSRQLKNKRAVTLLEVVLVLSILAISFVGLAHLMANSAGTVRAQAAAQKLEQVASAAQAYALVNKAKIEDWFNASPSNTMLTIPVGKQTAIGASPTGTPGFQSLQDAGFLPSGYIDLNSAGQSHVVLVKRMPAGLELLVVAHGGQTFTDADLGRIASQVGVEGGAVFSSGTVHPVTQVTGTFGGWSYSTSAWVGTLASRAVQPTAGRPVAALSMTPAQSSEVASGEFLSRVDTGQAADRTMSAGLNMGNNTIENVRSLYANGTIHSNAQIDSQRYVWAREGLFTEGNMWSRGDIGTAANIASPHGGVFAQRFCDLSGNCFTAAQIASQIAPRTCTRTTINTGTGQKMGNSCWRQTHYPPPPCPAGYQNMGEYQNVCSHTSGGTPIMTWDRTCERIACQ